MKLFFFASCTSLLLSACSKNTINESDYQLAVNGCAEKIGASNASLCLLQVSDSRCAPMANCVWEGVGIAQFSFTANDRQHDVRLATKKFPASPSTDTTVAGYHIQLVDISPYPGTGSGSVTATVRIR